MCSYTVYNINEMAENIFQTKLCKQVLGMDARRVISFHVWSLSSFLRAVWKPYLRPSENILQLFSKEYHFIAFGNTVDITLLSLVAFENRLHYLFWFSSTKTAYLTFQLLKNHQRSIYKCINWRFFFMCIT